MPKQSGKLVNHIAFVLDKSSSIETYGLTQAVRQTFDDQLRHLATLAKEHGQETRVSLYQFNESVERTFWEEDIERAVKLEIHYRPWGNTAVRDAAMQAALDLQSLPNRGTDHSYLLYVVTDGEDNRSRNSAEKLRRMINDAGKVWTFAALVPNQRAVDEAVQRCGFPPGNVAIWETTVAGLEGAGWAMRDASTSYYAGRATGMTATASLFTPDVSAIDQKTVNRELRRLEPIKYQIHEALAGPIQISDFVEARTGRPYVKGHSHYLLRKRETVQAQKDIILVQKRTGTAFQGTHDEVRGLLKLPSYEVRVNPAAHPDYDIYVRSDSVNRKLASGDRVLTLT